MSNITHQRFGALVAYDGGEFAGFQRQNPPFRTVQGEIERALVTIAGQPVTLSAAGRTDAGVHATGQVVTFELPWQHELQTLRKALNVNLPRDIAVQAIAPVPEKFHPRFDARRRTYVYLIDLVEDGIRNPFTDRYRWQIARPLDLQLMNEAAGYLVGKHDFATFGTPPQGDSTVRNVYSASWTSEQPLLMRFKIQANAFLYRMVRTIVGSLVQVGSGRWDIDRFKTALAARDRSQAATPAPPNGLYLTQVAYDMWEVLGETAVEPIR